MDCEHFLMLKYIHLCQGFSKCGSQIADVYSFLLTYNKVSIELKVF